MARLPKLQPCPFEPVVVYDDPDGPFTIEPTGSGNYYVSCTECWANGPVAKTVAAAAKKWNTRHPSKDGCPFGDHDKSALRHRRSSGHSVVCSECKAEGPTGPTKEEMLRRWKARQDGGRT